MSYKVPVNNDKFRKKNGESEEFREDVRGFSGFNRLNGSLDKNN